MLKKNIPNISRRIEGIIISIISAQTSTTEKLYSKMDRSAFTVCVVGIISHKMKSRAIPEAVGTKFGINVIVGIAKNDPDMNAIGVIKKPDDCPAVSGEVKIPAKIKLRPVVKIVVTNNTLNPSIKLPAGRKPKKRRESRKSIPIWKKDATNW